MSLLRQLLIIACLSVVLSPCSTSAAKSTPDSTVFSQPWISGLNENEPPLQAQEYDSNTLVMRQSLRTSFEAPFIYLLFGDEKALLIDSGAGNVDLRSMVDQQIEAWLEDTGRQNIALVVMHTHAHGDHVAGDEQFMGRADTAIVGHAVEDVVDFFMIEN